MAEFGMLNRRKFIQNTITTSLLLASGGLLNIAEAKTRFTRLTILHTNDMHSRIEPFPGDDKKYAGRGGMAARAALIKKIRSEEENVLLLDSGDIFQGTPYFNFFGGEVEFKLMSEMQYDAATLGNHDFDAGLEGLLKQLPHANFPFLNVNYDFTNTILNGHIQQYKIFNFGKLKVGVFGVGIELEGLVPEKLFGDVVYHHPVEKANYFASMLKHEYKCDYIICLSHLGYKHNSSKISDVILAQQTENIDMILGGHTHTFMQQPDILKAMNNKACIISQSGWAGLLLGRHDIIFDEKNKRAVTKFSQVKI